MSNHTLDSPITKIYLKWAVLGAIDQITLKICDKLQSMLPIGLTGVKDIKNLQDLVTAALNPFKGC